MTNNDEFETFLYVSNDNISISVRKKYKDDRYYENASKLINNLNDRNLSQLNEFLDLRVRI